MKTFKSLEDFAAEVKAAQAKATDVDAAWAELSNHAQIQRQKMEAQIEAEKENAAKLRTSQMKYGFYLLGC